MIDKAKIIQEARKLLAKGQIDKAIAEYNKITAAMPDGNIFNTVGDLYLKANNAKAAVEAFHKAAEFYTKEGFSLKALAIHKKVLNINPKDAPALIALGQLNEEKNISTDAIKYYLAAADVLSKENRKDALIEVYERILKLAPTNVKLRIKVSEMFSKEGFVPEAAKEYCSIGRLYMDRDDFENAHVYLRKSIEIQPKNSEVLLALSDLAEKEGNFAEAATHVQAALERSPKDTALLLKKAHLMIRSAQYEDALQSLKKLLELEPGNIRVRKEMGDLYQSTGDIMAAWEEYQQIIDPLLEEGELKEARTILDTFKEFDAIENRKRLITIYRQSGENDRAFTELYELHEAYTEQAKIIDALEALKQARDLKPEDVDVNQKIKEIERMLTPPEPEYTAADTEEAPAAAEQEEEGFIEAPAAAAHVSAPSAQAAPSAPARPAEKGLPDVLNEADVFIQYGLMGDARTLLESFKLKFPSSMDLHQKLLKVYREQAEVDLAVTECIVLSALLKNAGDEAASQGMLMEALGMNPHDPRLEGRVAGWTPAAKRPEPAPAAAPAAPAVDAQALIDETFKAKSEEISEAEFHMNQGFYSEANKIYSRLAEQFPDDREIKKKLAEVQERIAEEATAERERAASAQAEPTRVAKPADVVPFAGEAEEELFDFSSILEGDAVQKEPAMDALEDDVQDIFNEFKKGLALEIEAEDSETHYDLGIAYKEMGLLDDAIKEFQLSQRDPKFFTQAMSMIGICYMSKGAFALAVDAFTAALMKIEPGDDKRWSLKFDLGEAYERQGNRSEALQMYQEVLHWDASFRDVRARIERLSSGAAPKAEPKPAPAQSAQKTEETAKQVSSDRKSRVSYI